MFKFQIKCKIKRLDKGLGLSSFADITLWSFGLFISVTSEGQFGRLFLGITYNTSRRYFKFSWSLNILSKFFILAGSLRLDIIK